MDNNFELVQAICPRYINVTDGRTDRQTDGRTTYDSNTALCTVALRASRGKKQAPNILAILACDKIEQQYGDYVQIYTDASKTTSGRVGIGCYIRSTAASNGANKVARLTDSVAEHTGELAAIRMALENVR